MAENNPFRIVYALIWKANEPDGTFKQEEFEKRIPRLMQWLKELKSKDKLIACGGGGFESYAGGLTLINASSVEEAAELSSGSPMNEIGTSEIFLWDLYYSNLVDIEREDKLK